MNTPICDFVEQYANSGAVRLHMPGHKGTGPSGQERYDITEIPGADSLYEAGGIIRESEKNAAGLFGTGDTLYSTEGSSQCIRAMLYLAVLAFGERHPGKRPVILAGRNAHRAFLTACALLDFDVVWLYPENETHSLCRCDISPARLAEALEHTPHAAGVYLTSPDYLGNCADIHALAGVAHEKNMPLLVDNAHGAYRRFLSPSCHPISLGADICCDSAHKTLPVLTGGAWLHIAGRAPSVFLSRARGAMALFGSTSPSYLILQSLDRANRYMAEGYPQKLANTVEQVKRLKSRLAERGWQFMGDEPLKITLDAAKYGHTGTGLAAYLQSRGIFCEYADPDYIVFMLTPENGPDSLSRLEAALSEPERRPPLPGGLPPFQPPERVLTVRQAMLLPCEQVPLADAVGRIVATPAMSCPPAISPAVPGERISGSTVDVYRYYGTASVSVLSGL